MQSLGLNGSGLAGSAPAGPDTARANAARPAHTAPAFAITPCETLRAYIEQTPCSTFSDLTARNVEAAGYWSPPEPTRPPSPRPRSSG
ncbi:hypothetical protein C5U48_00620 [Mycolicibacter virginiensis]|uniref:Uncharacterized protein n=1 Tax=Mycolicibacter virginiensis TaxID=1795032 RepID=A0A9X7IRT2_9MYCO|nr:hypothetical protein C5U48_00620 [Mycolicibacter virginiensis]